jgi:hypothetical protein
MKKTNKFFKTFKYTGPTVPFSKGAAADGGADAEGDADMAEAPAVPAYDEGQAEEVSSDYCCWLAVILPLPFRLTFFLTGRGSRRPAPLWHDGSLLWADQSSGWNAGGASGSFGPRDPPKKKSDTTTFSLRTALKLKAERTRRTLKTRQFA